MLKLKSIINQLDPELLVLLEKQLIQNSADNSLFLLQEYKKNNLSDGEIIKHLNYNITSFHTLKSRLYAKIQTQLINNSKGDRVDIINQLSKIPKYCYETPRETAEAILLQLEDNLKSFGMSGDLITVYSALKKIHLNTSKYYEYSQLYNKHLAYTMALEKAEEILGSFIKALSEYYLSKSPAIYEVLNFIKMEIINILKLNKSDHIEIIHNIIILHLHLFTNLHQDKEDATDDLLARSEKIIEKFQNNDLFRNYGYIVSFLSFEYYSQINEHNKAQKYFKEVNSNFKNWLLLDNLCLAFHFLSSKVNNYCQRNLEEVLDTENSEIPFLVDTNNLYTILHFKFYNAICKFYGGKYRDSTALIHEIINSTNFKDILHTEIEIKLSQAYIYLKYKEFELAEGILRSLYRKIKGQNEYDYENAIAFSRILSLLIDNDGSDKMKTKILKSIRQFEFENSGHRKMLKFLDKDIEKLKISLSR